ncbi:DELLA protein RGL2 [Forsythia ovata]|uniref:DELLA protein RGL2 n=1 Tax=Forsythia ovata TaxID=205694 RepID=A0ABD1X7K1_9LAMI
MMQSEVLLPPWSTFNSTYSNLDHNSLYDPDMDFCMADDLDFSSSFTSSDVTTEVSRNSYVPTMFPGEFFELQNLWDEIQITSPTEGLESISSGEIEGVDGWLNASSDTEENVSSELPVSENSMDMLFTYPGDELEIDNQLSLHHLLRAYGEAMENGQKELSTEIVKSINKKSNPWGTTMERLAFNLFQSKESEGEYLRQELSKNFMKAFMVFYQSFPYGKFAHFTANSAILQAVPDDAKTIHIVDFDVGEGIQWPPVFEAISQKGKSLRFTSIKLEDKCICSQWDFEGTKKWLYDHARQSGLKLQIEETSIEDLASGLTRIKKTGPGEEWLVFNCMIRLPHMARRRKRSRVTDFLKVAKELLANGGASAGIVTFADGEAQDSSRTYLGYSSFFDKLLMHYETLFESLEQHFHAHLAEARTAMETLFLAPYMCPLAWPQDWEESTQGFDLPITSLEGQKLSQESLIEAKQIVNERESSYKVEIAGEQEHEMVLEWKGIPLVRVSTWI